MTSAATTIQAAFRGHSVRQGLNWKLPSGRTLRSTVREGLHQRPRISEAGASESSQYSTARDTVIPNEGSSSISEINTSYSSARPNTQSPIHSSRSLKVNFFCTHDSCNIFRVYYKGNAIMIVKKAAFQELNNMLGDCKSMSNS